MQVQVSETERLRRSCCQKAFVDLPSLANPVGKSPQVGAVISPAWQAKAVRFHGPNLTACLASL